jgi:trigger factor
MTAKWEKLEGNQVVITIEVDATRVNEALDEAFKKVVKKVNVPGFRKGKIPRPIFEQRFGIESLYQDAIDIILPGAYASAIAETEIEPVDRPEIDVEQMEKGQNLIIKATVLVKPEVKLGEYKGLEVEELATIVTDEDVDLELKKLQEKHAELIVVEDEPVANGDTTIIDFDGYVDNVAFDGGKSENYSLEIGSGSFIPGFEEQLIGLKSGEAKDVQVTFPAEYHAADLADKQAIFKVTVHDIKRKQLPKLDDEFAKDVNEKVETLADLKSDIKAEMVEAKKTEALHHKRDTLVEKAGENATIDIPAAMVTTEVDRMLEEFGQKLTSQGMSLDMYYQFSNSDESAMRKQFNVDAQKRVCINLTLEAIAQEEGLEASDEEVEAELVKMAELYKRTVDELKQILAMQGGIEGMKGDLKVRKAVDFLVENSKVTA